MMTKGQDSLSVAERNALQGFNDTIDREAEDFIRVNLVVCDPGEVLYSTLGHAALRLQCPAFDLDYIYTSESESVKNKFLTFLRGDLKMGVFAVPTTQFVDFYHETGRGIKEYTMNLSPDKERKLWRVMDKHVAEGSEIPYDYFRNGCAKSVVNIMHEALGSQAIHYAPWSDKYTKKTMRELGIEYVSKDLWEKFVLFFIIGSDFDKPYPCEQKLIVPTDLAEVWQQATLENGKPVLEKIPHTLNDGDQDKNGSWFSPLLVTILLLLLSIGSLATIGVKNKYVQFAGTIVDGVIVAIVTILGMLMTYLICFSKLPCTSWNWLIIPFNILPAIAWYWRKYWALPVAVVLMVWGGVMSYEIVWGHILVDWPHIILAITFVITLLKQYFKTK